jgi:CRP-like cAMP-binding protein
MSATPLAVASEETDFSERLAASPLFEDLPRPVLKAICETAERRRYAAGETVYSPGQYEGGEFLLVSEGRLKATFADSGASAMLIEEIGPGNFFCLAVEMSGDSDQPTEGLTLAVETDSEIIAFNTEAFRAVASRRPLLMRNLMLHFAREIRRAGSQPAAAELSAERRVFAALLGYVERDAVSGEWRVARMPKHRELGEKAGADEAATANAIARLIQDGIARREYPGLVIDDISGLNRLAS